MIDFNFWNICEKNYFYHIKFHLYWFNEFHHDSMSFSNISNIWIVCFVVLFITLYWNYLLILLWSVIYAMLNHPDFLTVNEWNFDWCSEWTEWYWYELKVNIRLSIYQSINWHLLIIYINISWHIKCKTDESRSSHLTFIHRDPWNVLRRNNVPNHSTFNDIQTPTKYVRINL